LFIIFYEIKTYSDKKKSNTMKIKINILLLMSLSIFTQYGYSQFKSKITPIPKFSSVKPLLPVPVIEENVEWLDLYWLAWETAFSNIKVPPPNSPLVSSWIDEGLTDQIFQWDTNFMTMFGRYAFHIFPFIKSNDNFYAAQHPDGMICRVINELDGKDHEWGLGENLARAINPPLFSWSEIETYKFSNDKQRLAQVVKYIENYAQWIEENRTCTNTKHRLYWSNGQASGMDNTPRDIGRMLPTDGNGIHSAYDPMGWVDLTAQVCLMYKDLSFIHTELGNHDKSTFYETKYQLISDKVNKYMWNENTGLYHDVDSSGVQTSWKTIAAFWPLLCQTPSTYQAERLMKNILDTSVFGTNLPLPSLAADQPYYNNNGKYWLGGVWAPTSYMVIKGFEKYGYHNLSTILAEKFMDAMYKVFLSTGSIWEVYSPEIYAPATNASGKYLCQKDFVGWSGLVPISMFIENIIGIKVDAPQNLVEWNISRKDKHGLINLHFADITASFICEKNESDNIRKITVTSDKPFQLNVNNIKYSVQNGENSFILK
jgi:hypothetical protein